MRKKILKLVLLVLSASFLLAFSSCGLLGGTDKGEQEPQAGICPECGKRQLGDWTVVSESTCAEYGKESRVCAGCGYTTDIRLDKKAHSFGEWTIKTPPTCVANGQDMRLCSECGAEETKIAPATGEHHYDKVEVFNEATCKSGGEDKHICTVCGKSYLEKTPKVDHVYGEWSVKYVSFCGYEGKKERFCKWCNLKEEAAIPVDPDNHLLSDKIIGYEKKPTCIEGGVALKECYYCKEGFPVTVEKSLFHDYDEENYKILKEATCTENGRKELSCKDCGDTCEAAILASGHAYGEWDVTKEPICSDGRRERVCSACGDVDSEILPATTDEHTYGEWTEDISATCGEDGLGKRVCSVCGDEQEHILPATGAHDYGAWTVDRPASCTEEGREIRVCSVCEDELERAIPKIFHAYGSWTVVEQPTCTEYGTRQRVCLSCGGIDELDDVKPTGIHTYGNWHGLDMLYHQHVCEVCGGTEDQAHAFNDGICSVCDYELPEYTKELAFTINADKQSYSVSGVNRTGGYPTTVVIPDYYDDGINGVHPVTRINKDVFSTSGGTCLWLRSIRLPDTLEYIDSGNFWHANIDRLVIPDSVKTIVANSFRDTTMRTLEIGTGLAEIGSLVFYSSTYLEEITVSSQNNVFRSSDNCLIKGNTVVRGNKFGIIPTDSSVTEIGSQAYNYASAIEELRIPSNIKHIRSGAFESCTEISRVEIHSKIESVAATVFGGTTVIEAKIPASCVNVLPKTVEKVVINSGTEIVGSFKTGDGTEANTALKSVTIVSTVTEIPEGTFENCVNLSELVCGNKIVKIGANAFKNCDALTAITLPSSLEEIGDGAFENCDGITEIVIHDKVKILGKRAFWNCKALVKVTVGSGVKRIDDEAFAYGFIEELTLKRGIEEIGESVFYMCKMTTLNIPDSVKKIEKSAFQGCSRITTVEGCGGIVEIGESAFEGCTNLLTVSFGASLRKIDYHAFYNDKKLTRINYAGTDMQWKTQITRAAGWAQGTKNVKVYCLLGAVIDLF